MSYLLGIDIGTSGTKTILMDYAGRIIAKALVEYPLSQPRVGWAEQNPEDWWLAAAATIRSVLYQSNVKGAEIKGIGLTGQMHGLVLLDKEHQVLRPAIIWCDQRTEEQVQELNQVVGPDKIKEITANPAVSGFTAAKLLWVRRHQPDIYAKIHKILLPKDYIRFRLTGEFATEVSDASGTQLLDIAKRKWSKELLAKLGVEESFLPPVYESSVITGAVSQLAAGQTGLPAGISVVGGAGDQAAGAVGNGIVQPGLVSAAIGTSGVVFASTGEVKIDPKGRVHAFCHAVPATWHVMGVTQAAGLSLRWIRDNLGAVECELGKLTKMDPYELLTREAEQVEPGCEGLLYLPYLMGERTPHLDANARGVFFGLSAKHTKNHLVRAVMEGVTYSLRDCLEILLEMGVAVKEVRASGGGARSLSWRQTMADVFTREITVTSSDEGPAFGAALLAGVGVGVYSSVQKACAGTVKVQETIRPIKEHGRVYTKFYQLYTSLYPALQNHFVSLKNILH